MRRMTVTTTTLSKLHRKNCKSVTRVQPLLQSDSFDCCGFCQFVCLVFVEFLECSAVAAEGSGGEEPVVRGNDVVDAGDGRKRHEAGFGGNVIAAEKVKPVQLVAGHEALDFIENGKRIERTKFGLEAVGCKPDGMAIGFSGLRAAGLAEV